MITDGGAETGQGQRRTPRLVLFVLLLCAVGILAAYRPILRYLEGPPPEITQQTRGLWHRYTPRGSSTPLTEEQLDEIGRLAALGYVAGSEPPPAQKGVTAYDKARAYNGLNLVVSGHGNEVYLMDMQGKVLHSWIRYYEDVWPDSNVARMKFSILTQRAQLCKDGSLIFVFQGRGLVKVDRDSNVLWAHQGGFHHDLELVGDDLVYALSMEMRIVPRINPDQMIREDFVCILDHHTGEMLDQCSILEAFEKSDYTDVFARGPDRGDITHTNTIEYLDGSLAELAPMYKRGNVLLTCRENDSVAVLDMETGVIVWATLGNWHRPHTATLVGNGNIILFDNKGMGQRSRVIEFEPLTGEVAWVYGETDAEFMYSSTCGTVQRLPNGNTLIVESKNGRAFEVTPEKDIVWEYVNPHRAGENDEFVAVIFDIVRIDPDFPLDWLPQGEAGKALARDMDNE